MVILCERIQPILLTPSDPDHHQHIYAETNEKRFSGEASVYRADVFARAVQRSRRARAGRTREIRRLSLLGRTDSTGVTLWSRRDSRFAVPQYCKACEHLPPDTLVDGENHRARCKRAHLLQRALASPS
jgi:hypothetical protein